MEGAVHRGEAWLVRVGETTSATLTLDLADSVWDGLPGRASTCTGWRYAARSAGLGAAILGWAAGVARDRDLEALRLDCVASNGRLRAYYEAAGFCIAVTPPWPAPRASGSTKDRSPSSAATTATGGDPVTAASRLAFPPRIRHLLFDADGVIQSVPGGCRRAMGTGHGHDVLLVLLARHGVIVGPRGPVR